MKLLSPHTLTIAKLRNSILIAFCIALIFVIFDAFQEWKAPQFSLNATIKSSIDSIAQIFYDIGNGLNEKDSRTCKIYKGKEFQVLKFLLPNKPIQYIRFDPLNTEGSIAVKEIKLVDESENVIKLIGLKKVKPLHQISDIRIEKNLLIAKTEKKANDPMLSLDLHYPLSLDIIFPLANRLRDYIDNTIVHTPKKFFFVFSISLAAMLFAYLEQD